MSVRRQLVRALEDADVVKVKEIIDHDDNAEDLAEQSMEIVACVCDHINQHNVEALPHLVTCCQEVLVKVAGLGNPKELMMAMLEQLDSFQDIVSVVKILPSLCTVLTRVKTVNMSVSWNWALNTVSCHLRTCPTPPNMGLERWERMTLDQTVEARDCLDLCESCVEMMETLVDVVVKHEGDTDNHHRITVLLNFTMSLLVPLSSLSQSIEVDPSGAELTPASRPVADKLMSSVSRITSNVWTDILQFPSSSRRRAIRESESLDPVSLPTYFYLLFAERMRGDIVPAVYTHQFILRTSARFIITLLEDKNEVRIHKGLLLLTRLMKNVARDSLENVDAEDPELISLLQPLTHVIVYQDVEELRKLGFSCYTQFIDMFSAESRYNVYNHLLNTLNHSGLIGWTLTSLKDSVVKCLQQEKFTAQYSGNYFSKLLSPRLSLKHGAETDLLEISDELLSTLNFVQFFIIRDKQNKTGIQDMKSCIKLWTEDLTRGLDLSIAHYQHRAQEPLNKTGDDVETEVVVAGRALPALDPEKMKDVIRSALNTFSLLQFNLARVKDVL